MKQLKGEIVQAILDVSEVGVVYFTPTPYKMFVENIKIEIE